MSVEANSQDKLQQLKVDCEGKGSILNYFKKDVTPVKSKGSVVTECIQNCSTHSQVIEELHDNEKNKCNEAIIEIEKTPKKREMHTDDEDEDIIFVKQTQAQQNKLNRPDNVEKSEPSKESNHIGKESNEMIDKLAVKSGDAAGKPKNAFAFMMANRDKQNEIIKKMAQDENVNIIKPSESKNVKNINDDNDFQSPKRKSKKKEIKSLKDEHLQLNDSHTEKVDSVKESLERKMSDSSKNKSKSVNGEILQQEEEGKEMDKDSKSSNADKDTVFNEQVKQAKNSNITELKDGTTLIEKEVTEIEIIEESTVEDHSELVKCSYKNNVNKVNRESTVVQSSSSEQSNLANSTSKSESSTPVSLGNAFTLLMTNRHKINKVSLDSKENESCNENKGNMNSKSNKRKRREMENEFRQTGQRNRKRKSSSSKEELDSSLVDFKTTPKRKKKRGGEKKKTIRDNQSSSEGEDEEILGLSQRESDCSLDYSSSMDTSSEVEVISYDEEKCNGKHAHTIEAQSLDISDDKSYELDKTELSEIESESEEIKEIINDGQQKVERKSSKSNNKVKETEFEINNVCSSTSVCKFSEEESDEVDKHAVVCDAKEDLAKSTEDSEMKVNVSTTENGSRSEAVDCSEDIDNKIKDVKETRKIAGTLSSVDKAKSLESEDIISHADSCVTNGEESIGDKMTQQLRLVRKHTTNGSTTLEHRVVQRHGAVTKKDADCTNSMNLEEESLKSNPKSEEKVKSHESDSKSEVNKEKSVESDSESEVSEEKSLECDSESEVNEEKSVESDSESEVNEEKSVESDSETEVNEEKSVESDSESEVNEEKSAKSDSELKVNEEKSVESDNESEVNEEKSVESDNESEVNEEKSVESDSESEVNEEKNVERETESEANEETSIKSDSELEVIEVKRLESDYKSEENEEKSVKCDSESEMNETSCDDQTEPLTKRKKRVNYIESDDDDVDSKEEKVSVNVDKDEVAEEKSVESDSESEENEGKSLENDTKSEENDEKSLESDSKSHENEKRHESDSKSDENEEKRCDSNSESEMNESSCEDQTEPPAKRRKRVNYIGADDKIDRKQKNTSVNVEKDKVDDDENQGVSKKGNISSFFKKISREEKAVERSKTVITVKADVHAPCDGLTQDNKTVKLEVAERVNNRVKGVLRDKERSMVRRSSRRIKKEIEDLDKIELLEQISILSSPKKGPTTEQNTGKLVEKIKIQNNKNKMVNNKGNNRGVLRQSTPAKSSKDINENVKVTNVNEILGKGGKLKKDLPQKRHSKSKNEISSETKNIPGKKTPKKITLGKKKTPVKLTVNKIKANKPSLGKLNKNKVSQNMKGNQSGNNMRDQTPTSKKKRKQQKNDTSLESASKSPKVNSSHVIDKLTESPTDESLESSSDEIFKSKKPSNSVMRKLSRPSDLAAEPTSEMSEDKENIRKHVSPFGKKSKEKIRCVKIASLFKVGKSFSSFTELREQLDILEEFEEIHLCIRDSRTLATYGERKKKTYNEALMYVKLYYVCSFRVKKPSGQSRQDRKRGCPFKIVLLASDDGQTLVIKELCLDHSHKINKNLKKQSPGKLKQLHVPNGISVPESENTLSPSRITNSSGSFNNPVTISPSPKRRKQVEAQKTMGRKLLSSQDNIKNQVKATVKLKNSPKGKKKQLSLNKRKTANLQGDIISKMTKTNFEVNTVGVEDSSQGVKGNKLQKRSKISPLVLKPPPKEQKSMKIKAKKKSLKGENQMKCIKNKSKTVEKIKPVVETGSRRTSRQAALHAKKNIKEWVGEEVEDVVEIQDVIESEADSDEKKSSKKVKSKAAKSIKPVKEGKLAPIFCKRAKSPDIEVVKITLSPTKLKARQDFLQSGVPDQIKKQQLVEKSQEESLSTWAPFPEYSHVQQKNNEDRIWNLGTPEIKLRKNNENEIPLIVPSGSVYEQNITEVKKQDSQEFMKKSPRLDVASMIAVLNAVKRNNPSFPVFSVFKFYLDLKKEAVESYKRELEKESKLKCIDLVDEETKGSGKRKRRSKDGLLKKSKKSKMAKGRSKTVEVEEIVEEEKVLPLPIWQEWIPDVWTQVYAPKNTNQVIGNAGHIKKLKIWLQEWKKKYENFAFEEKCKKSKSRKGSDFVVSDDSDSWHDDDDDFVSTYLLCGPPGVGKTATVYALAAELGYKVLEVNASSKRPGKQVMSQLAEATQSHSVSNTSGQPTNTISTMFAPRSPKPDQKYKSKAILNHDEDSQESIKDSDKRKGVSLVLFEDIDIVFEESDEGFLSTVNNFMTTTKRPIILTVSHASHSAISRIKGNYETLYFELPPQDLIAQHLQLICLANGQHICHGDVQSLVCVNKCDIRQSLLDVQVWSMSGSSPNRCRCIIEKSEDMNTIDDNSSNNEQHSKTSDILITDIFPETTNTHSVDVELYSAKLWGKVKSKCILNSENLDVVCDEMLDPKNLCKYMQGVTWSQTAISIPFFLPFPRKEKKEIKKYPLQPDDPDLKVTHLWQRYSWLCLDDEDDITQPVTEEKEVEEEKPEKELVIPKYVKESSSKCVESLARLYDTYAQLDVLDSHHELTLPGKQKRENKWWMQHPTVGLSDEEGRYIHWAPHNITHEITQELGQRAFSQCRQETADAIRDLSVEDWPQLSVPVQEDERPTILESQLCAIERLQLDHQEINERVLQHVPLVHQLTRYTYMDYLCFMRSTIRHDELQAVVSKKRRGRRYLSQMSSQYGIHITANDKIKLANSLLM